MVGLLAAAALATSPAPVTEMVTVSRLSVPRWVVATGQGFIVGQWMPFGYRSRDSVSGRGTSMYFAINRDHYEQDWFTPGGAQTRWRTRAFRHGRPGRLLHDVAIGPGYSEWRAGGRIHRRHDDEGSPPPLPVTPIEAFQQARAAGAAKRTGFASVDGHRAVRYTQGSIVWLVEPGSGRLLEERVTERGTRRGQRFVARQRIRILAVRRASRARLHLARGG